MSLCRRSIGRVTPPVATLKDTCNNSNHYVTMDRDTTEIPYTDQCSGLVSSARHSLCRDVNRRSRFHKTDQLRFDSEESDLDGLDLMMNTQTNTEEYSDSDSLQTPRSMGMVLRSGSLFKGKNSFPRSGPRSRHQRSPLTSPPAGDVSNNALRGQGSPAVSGTSQSRHRQSPKRSARDSGHSPTYVSTTAATFSGRSRKDNTLNCNNNARRARRRSRSPPLGSPNRRNSRHDDGDYGRKTKREFRLRHMFSLDRSDRDSNRDRDRYTSESDTYSYNSSVGSSDAGYTHKKKKKTKKKKTKPKSKKRGYFNVMPRGGADVGKGYSYLSAITTTIFGAVIMGAEKVCRLGEKMSVPAMKYVLSPICRPGTIVAERVWAQVSQVVSGSIMLDTWIASRNIKKFCLYVPLLLLVFLLLAGCYQWYKGAPQDSSFQMPAIFPVSHQNSVTNAVNYLHQEVKKILQKLKGEKHDWLSRTDVESLVRGILTPALESLKVNLLNLAKEGSTDQSVLKVLQNDAKERLKALEEQMASLVAKAKILDTEMAETKNTFLDSLSGDRDKQAAETAKVQDTMNSLKSHIGSMQSTLNNVNDFAKSTCMGEPKLKEEIGQKMSKMFSDVTKGGTDFAGWLNKRFVDHSELNDALNQVTEHIDNKIKTTMRRPANYMPSLFSRLTGSSEAGITDNVRMIVEDALLRYSADRTGMPDFALESAGGSVLNHRCSETYIKKTSVLSIFGIPLFYMSSSPRSVIQPEVMPGQCWAFTGDQGHLVIQLAVPIRPTAFSLEHIPKSLSIHGNIDSAPKDFIVLGLRTEDDKEGVSLGKFIYQAVGMPIQSFDVPIPNPGVFGYVMLKVLSNHGSQDYTCLYRFRVHGVPQSP